jgi:hypothetical protein
MLNNRYQPKLMDCVSRALMLPPGTTFTLRELFGPQWAEFLGDISPQALGKAFSALLSNSEIPDLCFHSVDRSPRQSRFMRLETSRG